MKIFNLVLVVSFSFIYAACPSDFYEDDCGNCWLPYCYDYVSHSVSYDTSEVECSGSTQMWVMPGDQGDPYFNNYCDSCPDGFTSDDCGNCWMGYCYTLFDMGLDGDGPHSVYYDLTPEECNSYGWGYYPPGAAGDPYYNSNCEGCPDNEIADDCGVCQTDEDSPYWNMSCQDCNGDVNGYALEDDCGDCQSAYCYDYVSHEISFDLPCDGATEVTVMPDAESNPYWNSSCSDDCESGVYDCAEVCNGYALVDDCGDCQSAYCYDYVSHEVSFEFPCDGPTQMMVMPDDASNPYWNSGCSDCLSGDANSDGNIDVLDIVEIVGYILDSSNDNIDFECTDMNGDESVDVLDIIELVNIVLDGRVTSDATEAKLNIKDGSVSLDANGFVGAVQMTLSHDASFSIELTDKAMVADYKTNANSTTLIVVAPESSDLFKVSGDFSVEEVIVAANAYSEVAIAMPTELTLSQAYPNPFNPSTTMDVYVPADGVVKLSVYNVMGQMVDVIHSGSMSEGNHSITWNASDLTSGMYFVRAESTGGVAMQKVMLVK